MYFFFNEKYRMIFNEQLSVKSTYSFSICHIYKIIKTYLYEILIFWSPMSLQYSTRIWCWLKNYIIFEIIFRSECPRSRRTGRDRVRKRRMKTKTRSERFECAVFQQANMFGTGFGFRSRVPNAVSLCSDRSGITL